MPIRQKEQVPIQSFTQSQGLRIGRGYFPRGEVVHEKLNQNQKLFIEYIIRTQIHRWFEVKLC